MDRPTDASDLPRRSFRSIARSLLRGWPLLGGGLVLGAALGGLSASRAVLTYQAEAVVIGSNSTIPTDNFGSVTRAVFATDAVLQPVIGQLGLRGTPRTLLETRALEAQPVPGSVALRIIGRASDEQLAADLANTAASSFVAAASKKGLGTFALFNTTLPGIRQPVPIKGLVVLGALGGLLAAGTLLLGAFAVRQPALTEEDAMQEFPAEATFQGRARLGARGREGAATAVMIHPRGLVPAVWRRMVSLDGGRPPASCCVVMVERRRRGDPALRAVAGEIRAVAAEVLGSSPVPAEDPMRVISSRDQGLADALGGAEAVIVVVSEGVRRRSLRDLDEELRVSPGSKRRLLVLVG
jgi:hypothetical protein